MSERSRACDRCLARPWLLARLSGHLDRVRREIHPLLALGDDDLIAAVAGVDRQRITDELTSFDPDRARTAAAHADVELVCRCDGAYPSRIRLLGEAAPAVLHVAGGIGRLGALCGGDPVAIVGSRRPSAYGLEVARALGRGLSASCVTVVSGMAAGVDAAAHEGALESGERTLAVLPGSAERAYPPSKRRLHAKIITAGAAVSELGPGVEIRRWMFPARNRLIAATSAMTVVVEASERSGALITARLANELGRPLGAVPGRIWSPQAAGPNQLLADGAHVVRDARDVLDSLACSGLGAAADADPLRHDGHGHTGGLGGLGTECGSQSHCAGRRLDEPDPVVGVRPARSRKERASDVRGVDCRGADGTGEGRGCEAGSCVAGERLPDDLRRLLAAIADGHDTAPAALARVGVPPDRGLAAIASLELGGYVRRTSGGRFVPIL